MQAMRAIEHENLEAGHAKLFNQHGDFFDVCAVHRGEVKAVVHMKAVLCSFKHFRVKRFVRPALVHVVLASAKVVQAAGHAAHRCGLAFSHRIFFKRGINAAVHVRIDHTGESHAVLAVMHGLGASDVNAGSHQGHLAVSNCNVGIKHHVTVWANHTGVFNQQVEFGFAHFLSFCLSEYLS